MTGRTSLLFSLIIAVCFSGIAAQRRECENATAADIVFLVDGSSSIGPTNFQEVRTFLRNIVRRLVIGPDNVRIGLAQYNEEPYKEFLLKDHMTERSLLAAVERIPYRTGNTNTGQAMEYILKEYFTKQAGSRIDQRVPQIAVVLTDGESADKVEAPAQQLRQHGVIVFGIGVGQINRTELETIANWPPERFLHTIDSYQALQRLTDRLLETVCDSVEYELEALANRYADIFFLVDSGIAQRQFATFRTELNKLINQLDVSESTYRIGLAQYTDSTTVDFFLNTYKTKQETQNAVKRFRLRPQPNRRRNLGSALQYAKTHFFTKEAGGRSEQGAQQYLVVVSGKDSDDPVSRDAQTIKAEGVTLIGMNAGADMKVLEAFDYTFPDLKVLVLKDIITTERKESTTGDCTGANLADIVFIVDESGSIGTSNFMLMRKFLGSLVSSLDVEKSRVRVGIVTYNRVSTTQAFLNTFNHKAEVLQFIKLLPYRGGGTYTGAALNFTRENVFITGKGSRKDRGIKQVAVVITDGKSEDSVSEAAINLRRAGVTVYCVGVENAIEDELNLMASHPPDRHVFNVKRFTELKVLKQSLQKILCENLIEGDIQVITSEDETKKACIRKEADIYFLMDDSGSIGNQDFREMKDFIIKFLKTFPIGPDLVRVGLVKYSDNPRMQIDMTDYSDVQSLEEAVEGISHDGGGTETGKALSSMGQRFRRSARDHKVPEYLIVITDGESTDDVSAPALQLREQGIIIYAIGVKDSKEDELKLIASDPQKAIFVNNFDALSSINTDIVIDLCSKDACKDAQGDVFFLTDSSESISEEDFQKMKAFMKTVIRKINIGPNKVHVGLMQFSSSYHLEFRLDQHNNVNDIMNAIDGMEHLNEGTNTGKAITEVSQYFDENRGGRPGLTQRLIVITDGESKDQVDNPAEALRKKGVEIYAIGVMGANTTQLLEISGSSERVYSEKNFDGLNDLASKVTVKICEEKCVIEKADVIFLVDSSTTINPTEYESMRRFMEKIVGDTTVARNLTQFGLITYADEPMLHFTLDAFDSKRKVLGAIPKVKPPEGNTYTGKAMEFSLQYFGDEHGGRKGVPQILMVITDGAATNPYNLQGPSDRLRQNGVIVLSIGVKDANMEQLLTMAGGDKSKVFYVEDFANLEAQYKKIISILCNNTKPDCKVADLVFLLDRSSSINQGEHEIMKTFTQDLVNKFNVSEEAVHVGLAQFSTSPKHEFYLREYLQKDPLFERINQLEYTGGDTYLAAGLNHIREYFEEYRGSRREVPKNLVVITDGDSHDLDEVEDIAEILKSLNIEMFAIGVGDVHTLPLLQITGTPERLFTVRNFNGLTHIKQKVVDVMCDQPITPTPPPPPPPTSTPFRTLPQIATTTPFTPKPPTVCTIDIAIGFDISQRTGAPGETLVSGHSKLRIFLPQIAYYVSSLPRLCCTGPSPIKTNIAFQLVDVDGSSLYDTNFEEYNEDVVNKVMGLRVSEPTYFNSALLNAFKDKFRLKSRAHVKVLLIFSDGLNEDVMKLESASEELRKSGISALLTVALEGVHDPTKLQDVEYGRGFGYKHPLTIGMPNVGSTILNQIDTVASRVCCNVTCKCTGPEGMRGFPGKPGPKGGPGQRGQPGFPGEEGVAGDRGPPGPNGTQGIQGCPGSRGQKGFRGGSGDRGEDGEDGVEGINGEQGLTGRDGARGEKGDPGNPGIPGIRGEEGQKGERGLRGDPGERGADNNKPGPKGEPGNPGLPGLPGPDGLRGDDGEVGDPGPDGRRGSPGGKGAKGSPGDPGLPGSPGAAGPQGRRGGTGERGPKGINGFPGPQGPQGSPGDKGSAGRRGPNGQKGQPGDPGIKGGPGSEGPRGIPGEDGKDGFGPQGPKGVKGDPGFPGYPGLVGEDGQKGTIGYPGRKGNLGRGGNSGRSGDPGPPGDKGHGGHKGPKGPPGDRAKSVCELVTYIRDNCHCCTEKDCPAYPTELVFGLDMSEDVTKTDFDDQQKALVNLLEGIKISESNCPNGARVSVVGYNDSVTHLIRFQDYHRKNKLIESVKKISLDAVPQQRNLGAAMRFVAHNLFKRIRAGVMMRKVAVFFSKGPSQDSSEIVTAMMEYRALNIVPVVISLRNAPAVERAMEVDETRNFVYTVMGQDMAAALQKVKDCAICYDPCRRSQLCAFIQDVPAPQEVNMDLVMVLDSSREMQADEYAGAQQLLGSVVQELVVSPQPRRAGRQARVAVVQQSGTRKPKVEFELVTYQNRNLMRSHLLRNMTQLGGSSALGQTLEFTLRDVLLKAGQPRRRRAVLTVVGTRTASEDQARLRYISQKAKCEGVAVFVVTVGDRYDQAQVEELAGLPVEQHLIHVGRLRPDEQDYALHFFRVFLSTLTLGTNVYPPPSLRQACSQLRELQEALAFDNGQGSAELEEFEEQRGGRTQSRRLDVVETLTREDSQSSISGAEVNEPVILPAPETTTTVPKDPCLLSKDAGGCQNYAIMWFFDSDKGRCSRFWYGGCGGNENRFKTQEDCMKLCLTRKRLRRGDAARRFTGYRRSG